MNRQQRINQLLKAQLDPLYLAVADESANHQVPKGAETHFKITLVSEQFKALRLLERHRLINTLLAAERNSGLHALSLHLYSSEEWQKKAGQVPNSPTCKGGFTA